MFDILSRSKPIKPSKGFIFSIHPPPPVAVTTEDTAATARTATFHRNERQHHHYDTQTDSTKLASHTAILLVSWP